MRKSSAIFLVLLLIFELVGILYPVSGQVPCTPDDPCYVTSCGKLIDGDYVLESDIIVSSLDELIPLRDPDGNVYAYTCLLIGSGVVLHGNNRKIVMEPPVGRYIQQPISAIRINYEGLPSVSMYVMIENVIVEGWDIGVDMASSAAFISGLEMRQIHVSPLMISNLVYNSTFRNNHFGVAVSAHFTSSEIWSPTPPPGFPEFSGITFNRFENNYVGIWMRDSRDVYPLGDYFLIWNNTIKNNTYGIYLSWSAPPLKPEGQYAHTVNWTGPRIEGNLITGNLVGIEVFGSKSVKILRNTIAGNLMGIHAEKASLIPVLYNQGGSSEPEYNETLWTGRSDELTVAFNTIKDNVRGVSVTEALFLNLAGNEILNNTDLYETMEIPSSEGNGTIKAYVINSGALSGWGVFLYRVSNSTIAENEFAGNGIGPLATLDSNIDLLDFTGALIDIGGENNTIRENYIHDNAGIGIWLASKSVLEKNRLENDYISTRYYDPYHGYRYWRDFDVRYTTVNGKPVVMVKNRNGYVVGEASQVFVFNSSNVRIEGMNLEGAKALGIFIENSTGVEIKGVTIRNHLGDGAVFISRSSDVLITGGLFNRTIGPLIGIKDSADVTIEGNTFSDIGGRAVLLDNTTGVMVDNNIFDLTAGISGVDVRNVRITGNRITRSMLRTYVLGYGVRPITEGEVWPLTAGPFTGMTEMSYHSERASIVLDGSDITIEGNDISNNVMSGAYIPSGENIVVKDNRIGNNVDGGLLLGITDLTADGPTLRKVKVSGNTFTNNGLSIIGDFPWVLYDGSSALFNYYTKTHSLPVSNLVVSGNTVNGKPLLYLENRRGVKVDDAGQVIAINSSITVNANITFTDLAVFAFNSNVTVADSTVTARSGLVFLASNVTIKNSTVIHGYEGLFTVYDTWELVPGTVEKPGLIGDPSSTLKSHGIDVELSKLRVENTTIRYKPTPVPVPLDKVYHEPARGMGITGASLIYDGMGVTIEKTLITGEHAGVQLSVSVIDIKGSTFRNNWLGAWINEVREIGISNTAFLNSSYSAVAIESPRGPVIINNVSLINAKHGMLIEAGAERVSITNSTMRNVTYAAVSLRGEYTGSMGNFRIENNTFEDANISLEIGGGSVLEVRNVTIARNSFTRGGVGIRLTQTVTGYGSLKFAKIEDNLLVNMTSGIVIETSSVDGPVVIRDNVINLTMDSEDGIRLSGYKSIQNVILEGNTVNGANTGVRLESSRSMVNVTVKDNSLVGNGVGLSLARMSYWGNYIVESVKVYNNYFDSDKNVEIFDIPAGGFAFNTTITPGRNIVNGPLIGGNYWGDYTGEDKNRDGFGDEPYTVAEGLQDYLPLMKFEPRLIANTMFPIIINEPGYYQLGIDGKNLSMEYAVLINASNVLFDGNGHRITGKDWAFYGVKMANVENVTVVNLNLRDWKLAGVYAENVSRLMVLTSEVSGDTAEGIDVRNSSVAWIAYNLLENLTGDGVYFGGTSSSLIERNSITGVNGAGVELDSGSLNNVIDSNRVEAGGVGVYLRESANNTVLNNVLADNDLGIYIFKSSGNIIYNNYLSNARNAKVLGNASNSWNTTKSLGKNILGGSYLGGNYWSDFECEDEDFDGICEEPYVIDENNVDYLPLTVPADTVPPTVEIISPEDKTYYYNETSATIEIIVNATDNYGIKEVNALINGETWVSLSRIDGLYRAEVSLPRGNYRIEVVAVDLAGNIGKAVVEFSIMHSAEVSDIIRHQRGALAANNLVSAIRRLTYLYYRYYLRVIEELKKQYGEYGSQLNESTRREIEQYIKMAEDEYTAAMMLTPSIYQTADIRVLTYIRRAYLHAKMGLELLKEALGKNP